MAEGSTPAAAATDCATVSCTTDELAAFDIAAWQTRAAATLPGVTWEVTQDAVNTSLYTVVLTWQERRDRAARTNFASAGELETLALSTTKVVSP